MVPLALRPAAPLVTANAVQIRKHVVVPHWRPPAAMPAALQAFARDERAELLGGGVARVGLCVAQVEHERPGAVLDGEARLLERGHARAGAAQLLDGLLRQLAVGLGDEAQAGAEHVGGRLAGGFGRDTAPSRDAGHGVQLPAAAGVRGSIRHRPS